MEKKIFNNDDMINLIINRLKNEMNYGDPIHIMIQAFYGNRTCTEIFVENIDTTILGYTGTEDNVPAKIDRTIIRVPNTENLVFVYNKYQEEEAVNNGYTKPLVVIPENNITLYSRCLACRMNANGEFESLQAEDYEIIKKYFCE